MRVCLARQRVKHNHLEVRPEFTLRSEDENWKLSLADIPTWTFDGSSANQASTENSELVIRPVFACVDSNAERTG